MIEEILEQELEEALKMVDIRDALAQALERDPVRVIEAIAKLKESRGVRGLGDSQLEELIK